MRPYVFCYHGPVKVTYLGAEVIVPNQNSHMLQHEEYHLDTKYLTPEHKPQFRVVNEISLKILAILTPVIVLYISLIEVIKRDIRDTRFFLTQQPSMGQGLFIHEVSRSHTTTHHSRSDPSGRVMSSSQIPLPDNTQQSQQTSMPPVGFEPAILAGERPQTHALDRAATGPGKIYSECSKLLPSELYFKQGGNH